MDVDVVAQTDRSNAVHLNILVVDDDEMNQRLMKVLFTHLGYRVEFASNGLEAFEAVKCRQFDIVFMDLQMPVMDGIESSRRIRDWEKNGNGPTFIVALTAAFLPEKGNILFEAGMDNYISKPFEVEHVERILKYRLDALRRRVASPEEKTRSIEVLDTKKGIQRVGGNPETYRELLSDFIQEVPGRIEDLRRLFADHDMLELSRAAHNLKGVSANLGALQLSQYGEKVEVQADEGYTETIEGLLEEIMVVGYKLQEVGQIFLADSQLDAE